MKNLICNIMLVISLFSFQAVEASQKPINSYAKTKKKQKGMASWYGDAHHGKKTASGEIFNMNSLTAAHRYLKLGTKVKVTNERNGKSVVVKINDRGPFSKNRIIDLSKAAATTIGIREAGQGLVIVQQL